MKVKELIEKLSQLNPELTVIASNFHWARAKKINFIGTTKLYHKINDCLFTESDLAEDPPSPENSEEVIILYGEK